MPGLRINFPLYQACKTAACLGCELPFPLYQENRPPPRLAQ
jgi:hypothetical protein